MEGRCIIEAEEIGRAETLRWRTGALGCLFPFMVLATVLFGFAAFRPELAADLAEGRRGELIAWTAAASAGGVNLPLALLALYLVWECFRYGWRWADEVAVTASPDALRPHRSLLMKPIPWSEVADARFATLGRAPSLVIEYRGGRVRAIRGVETEGEAAERFLEAVRARMGESAA